MPLLVKLGWPASPGLVQLPLSLIALTWAHRMPAGRTSHSCRLLTSTLLALATLPWLLASTRKVTASPSCTVTWSVLAGLTGVEPLTLATPLVSPIGGAAAIWKFTRSRSDRATPAELVLRSFTMLPGLSGAGPAAASEISTLNRATNTLPTGTWVEPSPVVAPIDQLSAPLAAPELSKLICAGSTVLPAG